MNPWALVWVLLVWIVLFGCSDPEQHATVQIEEKPAPTLRASHGNDKVISTSTDVADSVGFVVSKPDKQSVRGEQCDHTLYK